MTVDEALKIAVAHHQAGRLAEAEKLYRQVLAAHPDHASALHLLGALALATGHAEAGVDLMRRVAALRPDNAEVQFNLALGLSAQGKTAEAVLANQRAIALRPNDAATWSNQTELLMRLGRVSEAIAAGRRAVALGPRLAEAHLNLGNALKPGGDLVAAGEMYNRATELNPRNASSWNNLGAVRHLLGQFPPALEAFKRSLEIRPDDAATWSNLGNSLAKWGKTGEALAACRRAVELDPRLPDGYDNLGIVLRDMGHITESVQAHRQAITLDPSEAFLHSDLLLAMQALPELDAAQALAEPLEFARRHESPLRHEITTHGNDRSPDRILRVGYVSPDFRTHSVAYFIEKLLANHDPQQVRSVCYSSAHAADAVTQRLRAVVGEWRDIAALDDAVAARLIREDQIDILVDLAGHTAGSRLLVFARKPAPVQVTYLGYPGTTGLAGMDYRLTDVHADPPGMTEAFFVERLVRLPETFLCYTPPADAPDIAHRQDGPITFGSFNHLSKVNAKVIDAWSRILREAGDSRLLLKARGLDDALVYRDLLERFEAAGIPRDRVELAGRTVDPGDHLGFYGRVDLALDTFPYNGTTTTCEALWMGAAVLTTAGDRHSGRVGVSILSNLGLGEWIAPSVEDYVRLAAQFDRRSWDRGGVRQRMRESPLMDGARFARNVESAYRTMWRIWCGTA